MKVARSCGAALISVGKLTFVQSGRTYFDGVWTTKDQCRPLIERKNGTVKPDVSRKIDVLVFGDLEGSPVLDKENGWGKKVTFVFDERLRVGGKHIHIINGEGLNTLLSGRPTQCLDLVRRDDSSPIEVRASS